MSQADVDPPAAPAARGRAALLGKIAAGAAALAVLLLLGRGIGAYIPQFAAWVESLGFWGPIVFILGYLLATVAFVPGSLLTLAAGAIFGLTKGTLFVFIGAAAGTAVAFLIARYVARGAVERRIESSERFQSIDQAVAKSGLKIVFLLRLSPVFPYNLLNYALGLTSVRFRDYLLASLGMIPGTFLYVYYGKVIGSLAELSGGVRAEGGAERWVLISVGLLATIAVTTIVTRIARRALEAEVQDD